jgi:hypothetical protein
MPVLSAGVSWDARHSQLLLALRQSGGKAVLRGALKGADKPVVPPGGGPAPRGTCQLKVLVRELDAVEEHCVQVRPDLNILPGPPRPPLCHSVWLHDLDT